jgi:hypothetical protein
VTWLACADEWAAPKQVKIAFVGDLVVDLVGRCYIFSLKAPIAQWLH